jgi:CheY-like chemotaxis protein
LQVIKEQLTSLGLLSKCEFAYNGHEAVMTYSRLIESGEHVQYILTDFMMPRLNGIQAAHKILSYYEHKRRDQPGRYIPRPQIVFLTAYKTSNFEHSVKDLKVAGVYEKPLELTQLKSILKFTD